MVDKEHEYVRTPVMANAHACRCGGQWTEDYLHVRPGTSTGFVRQCSACGRIEEHYHCGTCGGIKE